MTDDLERACERLEQHLPRPVCRALHWARGPSAKWFRIPLGILCLIGGFLWFLPILGIWLLPIAFLLLAEDIPPLRKPVARTLNWCLDRWEKWRGPPKRVS
ncbi:MAG: hypothetical protein ABW136_11225 [Steroidobacteraceae bacterium]